MTVISEQIADLAGVPDTSTVTFWTTVLRENDTHTGTVTTRRHTFGLVAGVLTTTDLDPGPARVQIGPHAYDIVIPASSAPIRLWPLIDAGLPDALPPGTGWVRDGGDVHRVQALTQAAYEQIATPDPQTLYIVTEN
ncbi:hypothetical protein G4X40_18485 [Rhodococcus sp. D2-41]|uniref:phage upper tail fiber protein n=1 Tax=Speluncibacter jeojiensis TaxID=2710754 RepID=UPI0024101B2C|nr:hypothetical protein [Rhodococcus sp. D2-41]MDG3012133.1 hypothetical protein [Rhodococcus sp. D2-41]